MTKSGRCGKGLGTIPGRPGCCRSFSHSITGLTTCRKGAQKVVSEFDGQLPSDHKVLEKQVDGIGPYTAGAVASIAFNKRVPAIEYVYHEDQRTA
jgi:hypothetical protein